jgi:hypothetical protein
MRPAKVIDDDVRRANPVTSEPEVPPISELLERLDLSIRPLEAPLRVRRGGGARVRRPALLTLAGAGGCATLVLALTGGPGGGGVDVAVAVQRAITPGDGVLHVVTEAVTVSGTQTVNSDRTEWWSAQNPRRLHTHSYLHTGTENVEGEGAIVSVNPPRTLSWVSGTDDIRESTQPLSAHETAPDAWLREAYADGRVTLAGETEFEGKPAWRLTVKQAGGVTPQILEGHDAPTASVIVDAKTFVPLESVEYEAGSEDGNPVLQTRTTRYLTYEELPANPANEALLKLAPHPGMQTVREAPPTEH